MKSLALKTLCKECGVINTPKKDVMIEYVTDDIRTIKENHFVFYYNKRFEIKKEFNQFKNCYLVTDQPQLIDDHISKDRILYVLDVKKAYHQFIDYYRSLFDLPVVAITGTCGKTTTKEMVKQVVEKDYQVVSTISSKNAMYFNHRYLMRIDDHTDYGVFETAISRPGFLLENCRYYKPSIGVILNIGFDHLEGFRSLDSYIMSKAEMLPGLGYKGSLIINSDDENIKRIDFSQYKGKMITFGLSDKACYYASDIKFLDVRMEYTLHHHKEVYTVYIPGLGQHLVYNSLAALAVLDSLGIDMNKSIESLKSFIPIRSHLAFHKGLNGSTLIDDTWHTNIPSLNAALEVLSQKGQGKVKIAVFGELTDQGEYNEEQSKRIAKMLIDYQLDYILTKSPLAKEMLERAIKMGLAEKRVLLCQDEDEIVSQLKALLDQNSIVLFKSSMDDQSIDHLVQDFSDKA